MNRSIQKKAVGYTNLHHPNVQPWNFLWSQIKLFIKREFTFFERVPLQLSGNEPRLPRWKSNMLTTILSLLDENVVFNGPHYASQASSFDNFWAAASPWPLTSDLQWNSWKI